MNHLPHLNQVAEILQNSRSIAVVGLSPKEQRPSHRVAAYMIAHGYQVIPVNPGHDEILGQPCFPDLLSIPFPVEIVDIFRRSEQVPPIVQQAVEIQAKVVWMQQGITHGGAAEYARGKGLTVIMDRCIKVDHQNMSGSWGAV